MHVFYEQSAYGWAVIGEAVAWYGRVVQRYIHKSQII